MGEATAQRHLRLARLFLFATLANALFCAFVGYVRQAEPKTFVYVLPRADAVWVVGQSDWGFRAMRPFKNWIDCETYLTERGLQLDSIDFTQAPQSGDVVAKRTVEAGRSYYRIIWHGEAGPGVAQAPDAETATHLVRFLRYQRLQAGPLGFGLPLVKKL